MDVTQGSIELLLGSSDRDLRQSAWESYADGYRAVRNSLAATYVTAIKQDVFGARARRHASTCAASLHRSNVPVEVLEQVRTDERLVEVRGDLRREERVPGRDLRLGLPGEV